jgi:hypothetical protein
MSCAKCGPSHVMTTRCPTCGDPLVFCTGNNRDDGLHARPVAPAAFAVQQVQSADHMYPPLPEGCHSVNAAHAQQPEVTQVSATNAAAPSVAIHKPQ